MIAATELWVIYIELFMYTVHMVAPLYRLLLLLLLTARYYGLNRLEVCIKTWIFQQTLSQGHYFVKARCLQTYRFFIKLSWSSLKF